MISSIDLTGICVLSCLQYCHFCLQRNFCHFSLLRDIFLSTENSSFFSDCIWSGCRIIFSYSISTCCNQLWRFASWKFWTRFAHKNVVNKPAKIVRRNKICACWHAESYLYSFACILWQILWKCLPFMLLLFFLHLFSCKQSKPLIRISFPDFHRHAVGTHNTFRGKRIKIEIIPFRNLKFRHKQAGILLFGKESIRCGSPHSGAVLFQVFPYLF